MIFSFYVLVLCSCCFSSAQAAADGAADGGADGAADGGAGGDDVVGRLPAGRRSGLAGGRFWEFSGGAGGRVEEFFAAYL